MDVLLKEEKEIRYIKTDCPDKYAGQLFSLEKECFCAQDAWSRDNISAQLENERTFNIAVCRGEEVVGECFFGYVLDEGEVLSICVRPDLRGKGIARTMLGLVSDFCVGSGIKNVFLEVRSTNEPAIALYERSGFERISVRKKYYGDCDAVIMCRKYAE